MHRAAVLERDGGVVRDRLEQRLVVVARTACRGRRRARRSGGRFQRSGRRTAYAPARPSGQAIFPSSSTSAAPVACSDSIVVFTIASSDSSR